MTRFTCPACGFPVHNRRHPRCERCEQPLPGSLLFSEEELRRLDEDDADNRRQLEHLRQMEAKAPARLRSGDTTAAASAGSAVAAGCDGGGGDGCGGGD